MSDDRPWTGDLPRFKSEREIRNKVEAYFKERSGEMLTGENGEPVMDKQGRPVMLGARPPTVTGLALALGFTHREGLLRYPDDAPFARAVRRARMRAEDHLEGQLMDKDKFQGAKFNLACSFGWPTGERTEGEEESGHGVVLMPPVREEESDGQG